MPSMIMSTINFNPFENDQLRYRSDIALHVRDEAMRSRRSDELDGSRGQEEGDVQSDQG